MKELKEIWVVCFQGNPEKAFVRKSMLDKYLIQNGTTYDKTVKAMEDGMPKIEVYHVTVVE